MMSSALVQRAKPCEIPAAAGLAPDGPGVGARDTAGNWRQIAAAGIILLLAGCNGSLPPVPRETLIPVPVPCLDKLPERPTFLMDSDLAQLDDYRLVLALRSDQLELRGHVAVQDALMQACVKTPVAPRP